MATSGTRSDFITKARGFSRMILEARDGLEALKWEWDKGMSAALVDASGSDPTATGYEHGDFAGANAGLMKADVTNIFVTQANLETWMDAGNGTNLEKVR